MIRSPQLAMGGLVALLSASAANDATTRCAANDVEYTLAGKLELSDTPFGAGNGVYTIGPGKMVLRYEGSNVKMLSYTMHSAFTVRTKVLFVSTTITSVTDSKATPNSCGIAAEGTLEGRTIHWRTPVSGYRTDGTVTCSGFCGQFGAPPSGRSPIHIGPAPQRFSDFRLGEDGKTFTMPKTAGAKTESPKQTSAVTTAGREIRRTCAADSKCLH